MKNKVTAIALALVLTFSSTSVFAADTMNYTNFNIFDLFRNFGFYNYEPVNYNLNNTTENTTAFNKAEVPANETETVSVEETRTNTTTAPASVSNYEQRVAELVNVERQKNGLAPLALDSAISNVARIKSKDMSDNNYFAHQSPTYGSAGNMLNKFGIRWSAWGENIAMGQKTPEEVVNAWMNSPGHRANILNTNYTQIGVGFAKNSSGTPYWTQMFINPGK